MVMKRKRTWRQTVYSSRLDLNFTVHIQDETDTTTGICHVITIPDMGTSHTYFHDFVNNPVCQSLRKRVIWIHVDLPGQEDNAPDLKISKYPSLFDLAQELILVVDSARLNQAVFMGDGIGANIAVRFAMLFPDRCYGLILLRPTATTAGIMETMKDKVFNWRLLSKGMSSEVENYLLWYRFNETAQSIAKRDRRRRYSVSGPISEDLNTMVIKEFQDKLYKDRNPKNFALLLGAFLNRESLYDSMDLVKCDVLTLAGRKSSLLHTTEKFYDRLRQSRLSEEGESVVTGMENSPFLVFEDVTDVILEAPDKLVNAIQFFLQGLGLISGLPLADYLAGMGRHHRSLSMEIADAPSVEFLKFRKSFPR